MILLPDAELPSDSLKKNSLSIKIEPTGPVSPAIKRDKGAELARGELLAMIDDDAFPASDWLEKILPYFNNPTITAVGGPQITPPDDGFQQQVSGAMFLSPLNGNTVFRYWPGPVPFYIDDWPSVNLTVRRDDFLKVGGFDNSYWPGEDTKLCLDLSRLPNRKMIYAPEAKVFHHRRAGFLKHLKQVGNYGLHRGFFAKRFTQTSLRLSYFTPSGFFLFVILGWIMLYIPLLSTLYKPLWLLYFAAIAYSTKSIYNKVNDWSIALATIPYLIGTHFCYGYRFLQGLFFVKDLKSKLGR